MDPGDTTEIDFDLSPRFGEKPSEDRGERVNRYVMRSCSWVSSIIATAALRSLLESCSASVDASGGKPWPRSLSSLGSSGVTKWKELKSARPES